MRLLYKVGCHSIRSFLRIKTIADPISLFSKVWLRHSRFQSHLHAFQFDGVVDGGANIGEFAHIVRNTLAYADIVCVEPQPDCANQLRKNKFKVVQCALWDSITTLTLSQPDSELTSCTVLPTRAARKTWTVQTTRLDQLSIKGDRILIKLDLQGAEMKALQGMGEMWKRCAGLLLEVSIGAQGNYEEISDFLKQRDYYEYSTVNELEFEDRIIEADKLWIKSKL